MDQTPKPTVETAQAGAETVAKPTTEVAKVEDKAPAEGKSLLNEEDAPGAAPDAYADFKVPEGYVLDKATVEAAAPIFKELNLSQDQAQKLVDFYTKNAQASVDKAYESYTETRKAQVEAVKKEFGTRLPEVKANIGRALNSLDLPAEAIKSFRETMDTTGAGDFLPFIKVFDAMAKRITEGRPVNGKGPAPVTDPNKASRPSPASALFPNLPSSAPQ